MKRRLLISSSLLAVVCQSGVAQIALPGLPEENGLRPKSATIFLHDDTAVFNNKLEGSIGVGIANNGNVIVGWEDDAQSGTAGILDFEAVWTLLSSNGDLLTPMTEINSSAIDGGPISTRFLAYFRADGSPISGWTSWGPKIKANLFGDGVGMGATSFALGAEVSEFADTQIQEGGGSGDFPSVQLLGNDGSPLRIVAGVTDAHAETPGHIRIGDWEYLSNGNILIVGESRQDVDIVDKFGGAAPTRHAIFRIVSPAGVEVKPETLVSETTDRVEIWHGAGVTQNGFAIRFNLNGAATVRFFNNDGTPASGNVSLATLTDKPINNGGGRGDGVGFHGNGKDAYVLAVSGTDENGARKVWISVINADGTLRWTKAVNDDTVVLNSSSQVDAAIDEKGRVFAVFFDNYATDGNATVVLGRLFDATGAPMGGIFHISEVDVPDPTILESRRPRVAWRNNLAAVAWESRNNPTYYFDVDGDSIPDRTMAVRTFSTFTPGTVEGAGLTRLVSDTPVIPTTANALGNWEPNASVLGNSHFLIEGNTFAKDSATEQRYVVRVQPAAGGAGKTVEGFYSDAGAPYDAAINLSRQNGNPGRVAGDKRPGALNYIVGGEISAFGFPEFQSEPSRWAANSVYSANNRFAGVQSYSLDPATMTPTPLSKAFDAVLGGIPGDPVNVPEVSRFGGDVAVLDNGNMVVVIDDRSNMIGSSRTPTLAIVSPTGATIKAGFAVDDSVSDQIWSNVAAHKGGFALRFRGVIRFYDNAGEFRGMVDQNTSGESTFDRGRGDGTRIASHINSHFVFLAGGNTPVGGRNSAVKVAAFDSRDFSSAGIALVSEASFPSGTSGYDRVNLASDALDRVAVGYESIPTGFTKAQTVVRVLAFNGATKAFAPLTASFYPFANSVPGTAELPNTTRTFRMTLAMTTKQIMVAAKGEITVDGPPALDPNSPSELNFYTVFTHPAPAEDPTPGVGGDVLLTIARSGNSDVQLTWTVDGYTLETAPAVSGAWTKITTTGRTHTLPISGTAFFRLAKP